MQTEVVEVDPRAPDPRAIERAARVLLAGKLVAFPTETVYGLGALADDEAAIGRIYAAKGRPSHNPLIAHVPDEDAARRIAGLWPDEAAALARAFWPGPLTLVVPRGPSIPAVLSAGGPTMALRAPAHGVAQALLRRVGRPVAAPSANLSTQLSPTRAEHVVKGLGGRIDLVLDGGQCAVGIESTVVDVTRSPAVVLRPGTLSLEVLARIVPVVGGSLGAVAQPGTAASPGLERKHYAPRARLAIVPRAQLGARARQVEPPVGLVLAGEAIAISGAREILVLPLDPDGYAAGIFEALHRLDELGCASILVERVPETSDWLGVRDRLVRASAD